MAQQVLASSSITGPVSSAMIFWRHPKGPPSLSLEHQNQTKLFSSSILPLPYTCENTCQTRMQSLELTQWSRLVYCVSDESCVMCSSNCLAQVQFSLDPAREIATSCRMLDFRSASSCCTRVCDT